MSSSIPTLKKKLAKIGVLFRIKFMRISCCLVEWTLSSRSSLCPMTFGDVLRLMSLTTQIGWSEKIENEQGSWT